MNIIPVGFQTTNGSSVGWLYETFTKLMSMRGIGNSTYY